MKVTRRSEGLSYKEELARLPGPKAYIRRLLLDWMHNYWMDKTAINGLIYMKEFETGCISRHCAGPKTIENVLNDLTREGKLEYCKGMKGLYSCRYWRMK